MTSSSTHSPESRTTTVGLLIGAFGAYFCMYAFRKPIAAGEYLGPAVGGLDLKTALLLGQLGGYTAAKFLGIAFCSWLPRGRRAVALLSMILIAEVALVAFALSPVDWQWVAMFVNGLALGMVWGVIIRYLEGRRSSEILMAGLSASFILSSGIVKDVGRWLMGSHGLPEPWMPAATGALFLLPFAACLALLERAPDPDENDRVERGHRRSITGVERRHLVFRFSLALGPLLLVYAALTAQRDFRDNYGVEIFRSLGYLDLPALFTRAELPASLCVLVALAMLSLVRDSRRAMAVLYGMMVLGCLTMAGATLLFHWEAIDGLTWMIVVGVGGYLAYVPVGAVFFDRLIAAGGEPGTAVFGIYLADALGYSTSFGVQVYRDLASHDTTRLDFFQDLTGVVALLGAVLLVVSWLSLARTLDGERDLVRS